VTSASEGHRTLRLTRASDVPVRPVQWLWDDRVPVGALTLLGGREGIGKSTVACTLVAAVTRGLLPGAHFGEPKAVLIVATEDSWEHTIVPRLMAAGADLDRVYRVEVETAEGVASTLSLPRDLHGVEEAIKDHDVALMLLDPFLSRLASTLDTHKDADVRLALEPLVAVRCVRMWPCSVSSTSASPRPSTR
jgi:AAA domain